MDRLEEEAAFEWMRREGALALSGLFIVLLMAGFFHGSPGWAQVVALATLMTASGALGYDRLRWSPLRPAQARVDGVLSFDALWNARQDMALGVLLLATAHAFIQQAGTMGAEVYPLIYALLAIMATYQRTVVTVALVVTALGIEIGGHLGGYPPGLAQPDLGILLTRGLFLGLFGGFHMAWSRWEMLRQRTAAQAHLDRQERERLDAARDWRLVATGKPDTGLIISRQEAEDLLVDDAIAAIAGSIGASLRLLRSSLEGHTAALLWLDEGGLRFDLRGVDSRSKADLAQTLQPGEGALAGVLRRQEPLLLNNLARGYRGLPYYVGGHHGKVRHFLGVPVLERGKLRGVICLDRVVPEPFDQRDVERAQEASASILRAVQTERLFLSIERSRHELSRFYEASRSLNRALTPSDVHDVALESLWEICQYDFAAVVLEHSRGEDTVLRVVRTDDRGDEHVGRWAQKIEGMEFGHNSGLVSMATEMRINLPHNGAYRETQNVVFDRKTPLRGMKSLLILPMVGHDQSIGALVLASANPGVFDDHRRALLEVVANQVAVSLQNAHMYKAMEEMATIDGLTGLNNHRTFKGQMDEAIARAQRSDVPFTLLLTDIDHFKSINDTYGHPVGDEVLRTVSKTFRKLLRQTDLPARYGGEEFAVILEGTDLDGAFLLAERLRQEIEALQFTSAGKTFSISMSFGLSAYPIDAEGKAELIETADQALYYSKSHGRNQVRAWRNVRSAPDRDAKKAP